MFALVILFLVLYFLPTIVGDTRKVHNLGGLFFLNLLLGWTVIGWFAALIMACGSRASSEFKKNPVDDVRISGLERLAQLRQDNVLTEAEFIAQKRKLLDDK